MPAKPKFTSARRTRLLELVEFGLPVAAAARAVGVARNTVYKHADADPVFAARLRAARIGDTPAMDDWLEAARRLEQMSPERWGVSVTDGII